MQISTVQIDATDATFVRPDGDGPFPGVLLFMDAFGLRPRITEMAGRIAERGCAVLAPNILYRGGPSPLVQPEELQDEEKRGAAFGRLMPLIHGLTADLIAADTGRYLDFLFTQDGVADRPALIVGYCMGGTNAVRAIEAHPDRITAVAAFHAGRLVTDGPDSPHRAVGAITGEAYFGHADNDPSATPDQIRTLEVALDEAGVKYTSEVYAGAPHGFTMSDTAAFDREAEQRHWVNLFALLDRTFG
ncbi:dienelactone hydrolase family protein [Actinoplanes sp. TRM 88003]|uniref:Dienelactone hydrolase family protein n=1 Tax=Paractinoplanes aksuensis TaxID=2939490 RepID=A0ABT1DUP7_9ACTN|nr:dienelactone hydrolase family protein [Actinoplanes aksuensis]MCO8274580.1 dienelactone hydrolase family protein [Actinoplanes aksuensis]